MTDEQAGEAAFVAASPSNVETWQAEMARFQRDPEALKRRKEEGLAVGRMLREKGLDLPIVVPNPWFPVGDQIGREANLFREEMEQPGLDVGGVDLSKEFEA